MDSEHRAQGPLRLQLFAPDEKPAFTSNQIRENLTMLLHDLEQVKYRLLHLCGNNGQANGHEFDWYKNENEPTAYSTMFGREINSTCERVLLLLALEPHIVSVDFQGVFDTFKKNGTIARAIHGAFFNSQRFAWEPTLQTALFIVAGDDIYQQHEMYTTDILTSRLLREQVIVFTAADKQAPQFLERNLIPVLDEAYVHHLLYGREVRPDFGNDFPAKKVTTNLEFHKQLFLFKHTQTEIDILIEKIRELHNIRAKNRKLSRGLPVLFYGPPGTGKSESAKAIGNSTGLPVFRIDLANVVSKYVGETEKKLAAIFDRAEGKNWILFFDEADVLFGSRTGVGDAHDRYANLLTAYLLQRIEEYEGVCILSTNFKGNIDTAMLRRFTQTINFRVPGHEERLKMWENGLEPEFAYQPRLSLRTMAQFEFTGAQIAMILKNAMIRAAAQQTKFVQGNDMKFFATLEFTKLSISTRVSAWPGMPLLGYDPAIAMENPIDTGTFYDVKERYSISNVNLFAE